MMDLALRAELAVEAERLDPGPAQGGRRREHRLEREAKRKVQPQGVRRGAARSEPEHGVARAANPDERDLPLRQHVGSSRPRRSRVSLRPPPDRR
jgi:hypothetical protein